MIEVLQFSLYDVYGFIIVLIIVEVSKKKLKHTRPEDIS